MKSIILYCLFLNFSSYLTQGCSTIYQRKEIRDLTSDELTRFVNAVKKLQTISSGDGSLSKYDMYSKVHAAAKDIAHGHPKFLPWHRHFTRLYEMDLQRIDPSVHLPYWDWSRDSNNPASSIVLSSSYMGGNGQSNYCVSNGKFSGMKVNYPQYHCLQRRYNNGATLSPFASGSELNSIINYSQFSDFCFNTERKHGAPHNNIGSGYDFWQMYSPNDPLFMLHHAFIDMLWYEWQQRNPGSEQYEGYAYGEDAYSWDSLETWDVSVESTFDTTSSFYCYTYPRYQTQLQTTQSTTSKLLLAQPKNLAIQASNTTQSGTNSTKSANPSSSSFGSLKALLASINTMNTDKAVETLNVHLPPLIGGIIKPGNTEFIKKSNPLPDEWIKMNHLNLAKVRMAEKKDNDFIDLLNSIPGLSN